MADTITIRANTPRLIRQTVLIVAAGAGAGWLLQNWEPISRSLIGRLDGELPIPLVLVVVTVVAAAIAIAGARDSWSHAVELRAQDIQIRSRRGSLTIPYSEIALVKTVPAYGAGIALRDPEAWLTRVVATPGSPPGQRQVSEVMRNAWGVDVGIEQKNLNVDAARFVEMLQERTGPMLSQE